VGLQAQENLILILLSWYNFAGDSMVTFLVKRSCLPKSLQVLFDCEQEILP